MGGFQQAVNFIKLKFTNTRQFKRIAETWKLGNIGLDLHISFYDYDYRCHCSASLEDKVINLINSKMFMNLRIFWRIFAKADVLV